MKTKNILSKNRISNIIYTNEHFMLSYDNRDRIVLKQEKKLQGRMFSYGDCFMYSEISYLTLY